MDFRSRMDKERRARERVNLGAIVALLLAAAVVTFGVCTGSIG